MIYSQPHESMYKHGPRLNSELSQYVANILRICDISSGHVFLRFYPETKVSGSTLSDVMSGRSISSRAGIEKIAIALAQALNDRRPVIRESDWRPEYDSVTDLCAKLQELRRKADSQRKHESPSASEDGQVLIQVVRKNFGRLPPDQKIIVMTEFLKMTASFLPQAVPAPKPLIDLSSLQEAIQEDMRARGVDSLEDYVFDVIDQGDITRRSPKVQQFFSGIREIMGGSLPAEDSIEYAVTLKLLSDQLCDGRLKGNPDLLLNEFVLLSAAKAS